MCGGGGGGGGPNVFSKGTVELSLFGRKRLSAELSPLNSSLMMSLGTGALKVSGEPNAISRGEVFMATLEAGTTPRAATNQHRHTE